LPGAPNYLSCGCGLRQIINEFVKFIKFIKEKV